MKHTIHSLISVFAAIAMLFAWSLPAIDAFADQPVVSACGVTAEAMTSCCCCSTENQAPKACGCEMGSIPEYPPVDAVSAPVTVSTASERHVQNLSYDIVNEDAGPATLSASQLSSILTLLQKAQPPPLRSVLCSYLC
ncbi:MAG: hypothetical protein KJ626_16325 [Verrucomicrobia bacterium]|nr:hypothetical protein [Verrucomicrobiota bacterium]